MPSRGLFLTLSAATVAVFVPALAGPPTEAAAMAAPLLLAQDDDAPGPGVATSEVCTRCHAGSENASAMRDARGRSVAPYDLWQSSMMANSARDPLWQAVVSAEMAATPAAAEAIAAKCIKCHAPLAEHIGLDDHGTGDPLHALSCDGELGDMAREGVSCTICHGMAPDGLGTPASYTANFELNDQLALYGPHEGVVTRPMQMHSGFTPTYGEHITRSSHCGSCHTLLTDALSPEGEVTGTGFHEQTPYLEWRNSVFSDEGPDGKPLAEAPSSARSCQDCHVPTNDEDGRPIRAMLAHNPGGFDFPFLSPRKPFGRHVFTGGNAYMLTMLRDNAEELGVKAPAEAFDAAIEATREQLAGRTASLRVDRVEGAAEGTAAFEVEVTNLTGHKLPSGHPARRMWLEFVATGEDGRVVFASGRWNAAGLIVGDDGAPLPTEARGGPVEPHRERVTAPDQVARFRGIMAGVDGAATYMLLRGDGWFVDDRILPRGWRADHPDAAHTGPAGTGGDPDFELAEGAASDGKDRVRYEFPAAPGEALTVQVRLAYQSASPRYVVEALGYETPQIERFLRMYEASDRSPEILAAAFWR